jgi:choline dehydrogenase
MTDFDYLVIGGGTAGCVMAARLSEDPDTRVVLLEAGSAEGPPLMASPTGWFGLWNSPVDWADRTVPQPKTNGAVHAWPRGKVLGGSSGINGLIHMRGDPASYDRWEALGAHGWNYRELLPFLRRSENAAGRDPEVRGTNGPMVIAPQPDPDPLSRAWFDAALEAGHPLTVDGNGPLTEGVSWTEMNVVDGQRQSAADAYLRPVLNRPNLTVVTDAHVTRLIFDGNRCRGANYTSGPAIETIEVEREVIVCAGTIGTPHLLMRSGVGPAAHLRDNGIDVVADIPGVGQNLHDHVMCWISFAATEPLPAINGVPHVLLRSSSTAEPDLQLGFAPVAIGPRWTFRREPGFSVTFALVRPASRGAVELTGPGPTLRIDPAYFADERDLDIMVLGLRRAHRIASSNALTQWRGQPFDPSIDAPDDNALRSYIRANASTYFHPVGTCRIGTDERAVVDTMLCVRGVAGLRVVDASVMPAIVSGNTNATVLAIAEKAAALIRQECATDETSDRRQQRQA